MVGPGSVVPGDWRFKLPQRPGRFFGSGCFAGLTFCKQRVLCKSKFSLNSYRKGLELLLSLPSLQGEKRRADGRRDIVPLASCRLERWECDWLAGIEVQWSPVLSKLTGLQREVS